MNEAYNSFVDQDAVAFAVDARTGPTPDEDRDGRAAFHDPYFDNDSTVIAAFSFDHEALDRILNHGMVSLLVLAAVLLVSVSFPGILFSFLGLLYLALFMEVWKMRSLRYLCRRSHIAIATKGIYVDEVSEPNSQVLVRRRVFKYDDYKHCYVVRSELNSCGGRVDQVMLTNQMDVPVVLVTGLLRSQLFANKVNAMIEQMATQTKSAPPSTPLL
jgi:hypothetical protein